MERLKTTIPPWEVHLQELVLKKEIYSTGILVDRLHTDYRPEWMAHQILAQFRVLVEDDKIQPKAGQWVRFPTTAWDHVKQDWLPLLVRFFHRFKWCRRHGFFEVHETSVRVVIRACPHFVDAQPGDHVRFVLYDMEPGSWRD